MTGKDKVYVDMAENSRRLIGLYIQQTRAMLKLIQALANQHAKDKLASGELKAPTVWEHEHGDSLVGRGLPWKHAFGPLQQHPLTQIVDLLATCENLLKKLELKDEYAGATAGAVTVNSESMCKCR